jgi:hypothetical protein
MARPADPFAQHGAQALVGNSLRDVNCHVANLRRTGRPFRAIDLPSASSTVAYEDAAALDLTCK